LIKYYRKYIELHKGIKEGVHESLKFMIIDVELKEIQCPECEQMILRIEKNYCPFCDIEFL